jgi:hypothetical protein
MTRTHRIFFAALISFGFVAWQSQPLYGATSGGKAKTTRTATINGKTWTCISLCGAALAYYLIKLGLDNGKADSAGRAVDAIINASWISLPNNSPAPDSTLRSARADLINDIQAITPARLATYRDQFESLRTCWNAFIYAAPLSSDKSKPSQPPSHAGDSSPGSGSAADSASAGGADSSKAGTGSCTDGYSNIVKQFQGENADLTDLKNAFSNGPSLYQQIVGLKVGSNVDNDALRAPYLFYMARLLHLEMNPSAIRAGGALNLGDLATNCVTGLSALKCISSIGSAENTAAADRRQDVACDVALRSQLPSVTTILRLRQRITMTNPTTEATPEGPRFNFGAVPGC